MKNTKILVGLLLAYSLNSCSLFGDTEPQLPPETQNGAETFGCLVNGKVFVARGSRAILKDNDGQIYIVGSYTKESEIIQQVSIAALKATNIGTYLCEVKRTITFSDKEKGSYGFYNAPLTGSIKITKFERGEDKLNNLKWLIVSGTFEGILRPEGKFKDTIRITQGRFDVKFN